MKKSLAFILLCLFTVNLSADFSSLTQSERQKILTALDMASEYRLILDGQEDRRIIEAVNVDGDQWRIRVELTTTKADGTRRAIVRDVYLTIRPGSLVSVWPIVLSAAAGLLAGIIIAK